jgi:hypothetical protein
VATSSPILALPTPTAPDSDAVDVAFANFAAAAEKFMVGRFASVAQRTALIPTPIRGMESWVDADGYGTYFDGTIWRPHSGQLLQRLNDTVAPQNIGIGPGQIIGATLGVTLPAYAFPISIDIFMSCYMEQAATDTTEMDLTYDGTTLQATRHQGSGSTGLSTSFEPNYTVSHTIQMIMGRISGTSNLVIYGDGRLVWVVTRVRAL